MEKKIKSELTFEKLIEEGIKEENKQDFDLISSRRKKAKENAETLIKKINKNYSFIDIIKNESLSSENKKNLNDLYDEIQNILIIDDTNEILNYWSFKIMGILKMKISDEIKFYQRMLNCEHQKEIMKKYKIFEEILDNKKKIIEFLKFLFTKKKISEMIKIINKENTKEGTLFCPKLNFSIENENLYYYIIYRELLINSTEDKLLRMKKIVNSFFYYIEDKNFKDFTREEIIYIILIITNFNEQNNLPNLKSFTFIEENNEVQIKELNNYLEHNKLVIVKETKSNEMELNYEDEIILLDKNKLCFTKLFNDCSIDYTCLKNKEFQIECKKFKYFIKSNMYYKNEDEKKELLYFLETFFSSSIVEEMYYNYRDKKNKYKFLFKKNNAIKELFENFFIFPFNCLSGSRSSGFTNKYTLDVFISGYININNYSFDSDLKFDYYILFFGSFLIISIHECCGHYLFSYYYYIDTKIDSLHTPKLSEDKYFNEYLNTIKKNKQILNITIVETEWNYFYSVKE